MVDGLRENIPPCRRSSVMVVKLGRAEFALGAVHLLPGDRVPERDRFAGLTFMLTQVFDSSFFKHMRMQAGLFGLGLHSLKGRILTGQMSDTDSLWRRS